jgi:predicted CoA-binding protein
MKHMNRAEVVVAALLRSSRVIAIIGASPNPARHSCEVVSYLHAAGYDVVPLRPDRAPVAGLPTYASLDDIGGSVDLVVIFRRPDAVVPHIREAAAKRAHAVWLPPGVWSRAAEEEAQAQRLTLVKERCIIEEHRHLSGARGEAIAGHPKKQGIHVSRRQLGVDGEVNSTDPGYTAGGGGGSRGGGGVRAVLDEKKMRRPRRR